MNESIVKNEKNRKTQDVYSNYRNEKDYLILCKEIAETKYRNGVVQTRFPYNVLGK